MTQTELTKKSVSQVGEEITHELGAQMIKDFQSANPNDVKSFLIGRNIIEQILAQPDCVGMQFYNAYNEEGEKTLVYVGLDQFGKSLVEYAVINNKGNFESHKAIVADKVRPGGENLEEDWFWMVD